MTPQLHPRWHRTDPWLKAEITPGNFKNGLLLINAIGYLAEKYQHHPDLRLGYNRVEIRLTTHDARQITDKDYRLAAEIDRLLASDNPL
ncbi:MAG TPA: 4a-hydroxytetrahydrobiopterin dehydratase [Halothiobacillus sp.]|nr:MAG: hypothetical protein B7Z82_03925 [Halothiobacillus sp. 20-54-6]HQT43515.1 4a-hydroxytetrahydrobiopterin dehydratase [Halothiobacillus sp.]